MVLEHAEIGGHAHAGEFHLVALHDPAGRIEDGFAQVDFVDVPDFGAVGENAFGAPESDPGGADREIGFASRRDGRTGDVGIAGGVAGDTAVADGDFLAEFGGRFDGSSTAGEVGARGQIDLVVGEAEWMVR